MSKRLFIVFPVIMILFTSVADRITEPEIISKPVQYGEERIRLSLEYLKNRHGLVQTRPTIVPKFVILHYTAGGTLESNFNYFNKSRIESARSVNKSQSELNVSAHYIVDRDGKIYNLIPDTLFARHAIGLNYCAIGVENIGSKTAPLTQAQVEANARLVRLLRSRFNIQFLIGHHEYGKFRNTAYWKESNPQYYTGKEDPGPVFMKNVRTLLTDLGLKSAP